MPDIYYNYSDTALGIMLLAASERGVCFIHFADKKEELFENLHKQYPDKHIYAASKETLEKLSKWSQQIIDYLDGKNKNIDLPLEIIGTEFQEKVWNYLIKIPVGKLESYTELANNIGMPKANRAVAIACSANNIAIVIPCHRIIKKNGNFSGYKWGKMRKNKLIELEKDFILR